MNTKKEFLTWVLMKYGRTGVPITPSELAKAYAASTNQDYNNFTVAGDHSLCLGDYKENQGRGLNHYLDYVAGKWVLTDEALEYINET